MEKLGIQPTLLLAQIVNFTIIAVVLSKFLYKPIIDMLEKRKKEIAEGLALTNKLRDDDEKFQAKKQKMLEQTRKEAQDILELARKQAKEEEKDIVAAAHKEAEAIAAKGKADVVAARADMEKSVQQNSIDLAVVMAQRLLAGVLSPDEKHKLIAKHIKQLESVKVS